MNDMITDLYARTWTLMGICAACLCFSIAIAWNFRKENDALTVRIRALETQLAAAKEKP